MTEFNIDWNKIDKKYRFEEIVGTLLFCQNLLKPELVSTCSRRDILDSAITWTDNKGTQLKNLCIFNPPSYDATKTQDNLTKKFNESVKPLLDKYQDISIYLFLNTNATIDEFGQYGNLQIVPLDEITELIQGDFKPVFEKYFVDVLVLPHPMQFDFLEPFLSSIPDYLSNLSIRKIKNVISWLEEIAIYRPKELLKICQDIYALKLIEDEYEDTFWGKIQLKRKDYIEGLPALLFGVSHHFDWFGDSVKLLIQIENELYPIEADTTGLRKDTLHRVTGFNLGRDFIILSSTTTKYNPKFNFKTLEVYGQLIAESDSGTKMRCINLVKSLLELSFNHVEWVDAGHDSRLIEYRIDLNFEELSAVRNQAWDLLFSTFSESADSVLRFHCLESIKNTLYNKSLSPDLSSDYKGVIGFVESNISAATIPEKNQFIDILNLLSKAKLTDLENKIKESLRKLHGDFELDLYNCIFSPPGYPPDEEKISNIIPIIFDKYNNKEQALLHLINAFLKTPPKRYSYGLRDIFIDLAKTYPQFVNSLINNLLIPDSIIGALDTELKYNLGYLLVGLRFKHRKQWNALIDVLINHGTFDSKVIALTGFRIHYLTTDGVSQEDLFSDGDLEVIKGLISDNEELNLYITETLWYFKNFPVYAGVMDLFLQIYSSTKTKKEEIAAIIGSALSQKAHTKSKELPFSKSKEPEILEKIVHSFAGLSDFDFDTMFSYHLEILLRIVWRNNPEGIYDFFRQRLKIIGSKDGALPNSLSTLFQDVSSETRAEFLSRVIDWVEEFGLNYNLVRLITEIVQGNLGSEIRAVLDRAIDSGNTNKILIVADAIRDFPLDNQFYELAIACLLKLPDDNNIRAGIWGSFISSTGGSRMHGEPFPSHIRHMDLIDSFQKIYKDDSTIGPFLRDWRKHIIECMQEDQERDIEY